MNPRNPKIEDQEQSKTACNLILDLMKLNPKIDGAVWIAACMSVVANILCQNDIPYEEYRDWTRKSAGFYKKLWNQK